MEDFKGWARRNNWYRISTDECTGNTLSDTYVTPSGRIMSVTYDTDGNILGVL